MPDPGDSTPFESLGPGEYFVRREAGPGAGYEEEYWGTVTDPDGNRRDRLKERARFLDSVETELAFVAGLEPGRILDVGCGPGFFLSGVDEAWERHGVEISGFAAEHARQWGTIHNGTLDSAGYHDGHFQVVVLHHVIEHVADPAALLGEIRRVLDPERGRLVLGTPDFDGICARRFGERFRLLHDPTHVTLFSEESLRRLLRDTGFVVEHLDRPYFGTDLESAETLAGVLADDGVSPPFPGNVLTFYCRPMTGDEAARELAHLEASLKAVFGRGGE